MVDEEIVDYQEKRAVLHFFWTWPLRTAAIAKLFRQVGHHAMSIVFAMQGPNKYNVSAYVLSNVLAVTP